jgi:DNA-binding CsgD family transcriptional regulator
MGFVKDASSQPVYIPHCTGRRTARQPPPATSLPEAPDGRLHAYGLSRMAGWEKNGLHYRFPGQLGAVPEGGGSGHGQRAAGRRSGGGGVRQGVVVVAEGPPPSGTAGLGGAYRAQRRGVVVARRVREQPLAGHDAAAPGDMDDGLDAALLAALRHLPDRQREVIALRVFLDLDTDTIAVHLGIAPGTVRAHLSRAVTTLRHELSPSDAMEAG